MFISKPQLVKVERPKVLGIFASDPGFVPQKQPDMWACDAPLIYEYGTITITIPKNCTTDFASTPKVLQFIPFLDINGDSRLPGALHDGIYRLGREKGKDFADLVLYAACLDMGFKKWQAGAYYQAVHRLGTSAWDGDGQMPNYGNAASRFVAQADYDAWVKSGASIYS
jgi:hypothetical protein